MKTLIVYESKYGSAKKCAEYLNQKIPHSDLATTNTIQNKLNTYDQIIIGGSVYIGKLHKNIRAFLTNNETTLLQKKVVLYFCAEHKDQIPQMIEASIPLSIQKHAHVIHVGKAYYLENMGFLSRLMMRMAKVTTSVEEIQFSLLDDIVRKIRTS